MNITRIAKLSILVFALFTELIQSSFAEPIQEEESYHWSDSAATKPVLLKWAPPPTFIWYYSNASKPYWLKPEEGLKLFQNAAMAWQNCGVHIIYGGQTDQNPKPNRDQNIVGWGELPGNIRGFTFRSQKGGILSQSDIMINMENFDIKRDPRLLQKVVTHEFGHALGLYHSKGCYDVMSSAAVCGKGDMPPPLQPTINDLEQCKNRYELK